MRKRVTTFILTAAVAVGALTGVHAHAGEHDCPMAGMGADCCATAREDGGKPQVSAARLCCALNCTEPGTTGPTGAFELSATAVLALYTGAVPPAAASSSWQPRPRSRRASESPPDSHPAYIRHLALLI